jgi:hypothetical protein
MGEQVNSPHEVIASLQLAKYVTKLNKLTVIAVLG